MSFEGLRAAIYARISDDRENDEKGVKRQLKDGRALVRTRGGTIVLEEVDNDISALAGKHRPGYDAIMEAAEAGQITHIVIWQTSRLWRNRRERADGIERLAKARVSVLACKGPDLDMTTAYGRGMAGLVGEFDTMESEVKSERIRAKVIELAQEGKIANGGPRPFGYTRIYSGKGPRRRILRDEINPVEAEIIRDCVRKFLAGDTLRSIVGDLNVRGVKTSTGGRWTMQGMRSILRSGRIAGLREHHDVVVGPAEWPAIIDRETHEQLRSRLDSRHRQPGSRVRLHYLTGFVICAGCGCRMKVKRAHGKFAYACPPKAEGGCGGRVIGKSGLENLVDEYMVAKLSDPQTLRELAARESHDDDESKQIMEEIETDGRRLAMLKDALSDGNENEMPEVLAALRRVRDRLTANRRALAAIGQIPAVAGASLPDLAARWAELDLDRKQGLLRLFVSEIRIGPAVRGLGFFDPARVERVPASPNRARPPR